MANLQLGVTGHDWPRPSKSKEQHASRTAAGGDRATRRWVRAGPACRWISLKSFGGRTRGPGASPRLAGLGALSAVPPSLQCSRGEHPIGVSRTYDASLRRRSRGVAPRWQAGFQPYTVKDVDPSTHAGNRHCSEMRRCVEQVSIRQRNSRRG